jgi:hypothetical protein
MLSTEPNLFQRLKAQENLVNNLRKKDIKKARKAYAALVAMRRGAGLNDDGTPKKPNNETPDSWLPINQTLQLGPNWMFARDPILAPGKQNVSVLDALEKSKPGYVASSIDNPSGKVEPGKPPGPDVPSLVNGSPKTTNQLLKGFARDQIAGNPKMRDRLRQPRSIEARMAEWDYRQFGRLTLGDMSGLTQKQVDIREQVKRSFQRDVVHEREGYAPQKTALAATLDKFAPLFGLGDLNKKIQDEEERAGIGDSAQQILDMGSEFGQHIAKGTTNKIQQGIDAIGPKEIGPLWREDYPEPIQRKVNAARADLLKGYFAGLIATPGRWVGGLFAMPNAIATALDPDTGGPKWDTVRGFLPENPFTLGFTEETKNLTAKELGQRFGAASTDWFALGYGLGRTAKPRAGGFTKAQINEGLGDLQSKATNSPKNSPSAKGDGVSQTTVSDTGPAKYGPPTKPTFAEPSALKAAERAAAQNDRSEQGSIQWVSELRPISTSCPRLRSEDSGGSEDSHASAR